MKKYISGLITGIIICISFTTFALIELNVIPNPYSIMINGDKSQVDGYNINNSTYLKLRDFEKAGLKVDFQNNNILITSQTQTINNSEVDNMSTIAKPIFTTYKNCEAIEKDGILYVAVSYLKLFNFKYDGNTQTISFVKNNETISFNKFDNKFTLNYAGKTYVKLSIIE